MIDLVTSPNHLPPTGTPPVPEDALAAAVAGCPDVDSLSAGLFGEVATYLPGRRVTGVRVGVDSIEIHVIARWGTPLPAIAEQVRSACEPLAGGRRVDVTIEDVIADNPTPAAASVPTDLSTLDQSTPENTPDS